MHLIGWRTQLANCIWPNLLLRWILENLKVRHSFMMHVTPLGQTKSLSLPYMPLQRAASEACTGFARE